MADLGSSRGRPNGRGTDHRRIRWAPSISDVEVDTDKLMQFVFRAVDEVGATLNTALVVMGDKLGLYRALAGTGGLTLRRARRAHRTRPSATCASG